LLAGHAVSKQGRYFAAFSGLTCLDIQRDGRFHALIGAHPATAIEELQSRLLLFFTSFSRSADTILRAQQGRPSATMRPLSAACTGRRRDRARDPAARRVHRAHPWSVELLREGGLTVFTASERRLRRGLPERPANVLLFSRQALDDLVGWLPV
jgi:hypothetical protein